MAEVTLYKQDGTTSGSVNLPDALFAVKVKPDVVHEAIVIQEANSRTRLAQAKDRSEKRGGGRKPWKQKGTGRARHGSRRSPIWKGGGVTFGPLAARAFGKKINKKTKRAALAMMLSDKVASELFVAVENYNVPEVKTKIVADMRKALPGTDATALIVTTKEDMNLVHASQNFPKTQTISAESLNVRDLAKYAYVIASAGAIEKMNEMYS